MSWTQGIQTRDTLPKNFLVWADAQSELGICECIIWDDNEPDILHIDYYKDGEFQESKTFRLKLGSK